MTTEARAQVEPQRHPTEKHARAWETFGNIIGFLIGLPILVAALWYVQVGLHWSLPTALLGALLLSISVGLLIPSRLYQRRRIRAFGFVALSLATAVTICFVALSGIGIVGFVSDTHYEFAPLLVLFSVGMLIASVLALSCTCVLVFKIKPRPRQAAIAIAAGIGVSLLASLASYLLWFQHW